MSSKFIINRDKLPEGFSLKYYTHSWMWGKAHKTEDNDFVCMSLPVACKDYLVDIQYMSISTIKKLKWTEKEIKENCYWIQIPPTQQKIFFKNVEQFLHPYEKKHRIKRTKITQVPYGNSHLFIIEGSVFWSRTCSALSLYLSLIRLCGYSTALSINSILPVIDKKEAVLCNEHDYLQQLTETRRLLFDEIFKNPRLLSYKVTKKNTFTGYPEEYHITHGITGPFYTLLYSHRGYPYYTEKLKLGYIYKLVQKLQKRLENKENVKM